MGHVILESDDTLRQTAEVNQRMAKGWKPLDGVSCYYHSSNESGTPGLWCASRPVRPNPVPQQTAAFVAVLDL